MGICSKIQIACSGWLGACGLLEALGGRPLFGVGFGVLAIGSWCVAHWRSHL